MAVTPSLPYPARQPTTVPPVTIITVAYNSREVLPGLVESLPAACQGVEDWHVVLVDNASDDDSAVVLRALLPEATLVRSNHNGGFAAGVNLGLERVSDDRAVLLVNPDARLHPGSVRALLDGLETQVGIVAPRLLEEDGSNYPSLRREPSVVRVFVAALLGERLAGRLGGLGEVITARRAYERSRDVAWAGGAVLLFAPHLVRRIGLLDESFFLYSEETEYALRARRYGFRVRYEPSAVATHLGGEGTSSPRLYRLLIANKVRLYARSHPGLAARAYRRGMMLHQWARAQRGNELARQGLAALRDRSLLDG